MFSALLGSSECLAYLNPDGTVSLSSACHYAALTIQQYDELKTPIYPNSIINFAKFLTASDF